jgi:endonuclease/exonuclease/phosphatase (EEP) superfamily protein YafD
VHSLDRVWLGDAWAVTDAQALDRHGSTRRPLLVDLEPVSATAQ